MAARSAAELPPEGEKLLAASPEDFVAERTRVVRELREAGREEEAGLVAALKKPPLVVLAVNRAARDRPQAARDAGDAAERLREAQLAGDAEAYRGARDDLERASGLLAEVAAARLSRGKDATEAMRRRVADLLRAATADERARGLLLRGSLVEELEAPGFAPFEGATFGAGTRQGGGRGRAKASERGRREERRRARQRELQVELERAQDELRTAERALKDTERDRDRAARAVASIEAKLDRL